MELKKSPSANLENKKLSFTLLGLVIVLAIVYIAVEWTNRDIRVVEVSGIVEIQEDDELVPITIHDATPPPPPPDLPPPPPVVSEVFEIVDDSQDVRDAPSFSSDDNAPIVIPPPIVVAPIEDDPDEHTVFIVVEKMPSFPGGEAAMRRFISSNIRYPKIAEENGVEGRVVVTFVVGRNGEITDVEIMRSVDRHLDAEAIRVVNAMPRWTPGEQRGKPVKVKYVLPVVFKL